MVESFLGELGHANLYGKSVDVRHRAGPKVFLESVSVAMVAVKGGKAVRLRRFLSVRATKLFC